MRTGMGASAQCIKNLPDLQPYHFIHVADVLMTPYTWCVFHHFSKRLQHNNALHTGGRQDAKLRSHEYFKTCSSFPLHTVQRNAGYWIWNKQTKSLLSLWQTGSLSAGRGDWKRENKQHRIRNEIQEVWWDRTAGRQKENKQSIKIAC